MPVHTNYYICNRCQRIGVFQRVSDDVWSCRYCGNESADKAKIVDESPRCVECRELLPRGTKAAYDFLYGKGEPIMPQDLRDVLENVVAANDRYVQGMSPNSAFLTGFKKLTGVGAESFVQAAQHARRYHGSQMRNLRRARMAAQTTRNGTSHQQHVRARQ